MYYLVFYTIPPNTPESAPYVATHELVRGMIRQVDIGFPHGASGLTHVQLYRYEHQFYPTTPGESFAWNDHVYTVADNYPLTEAPYELIIRAWNDDDTFPHKIFVGVEIEMAPPERELRELRRSLEMLGLFRGP